jgi:hypothetical protein
MSTALDVRTTLGDRVDATPTSLDLHLERALTIEEWSEIGRRLGRIGNSALWWIGDWLRVGEKAYGSTYEEAEAITGYPYQTLADAAWVSGKVDFSDRSEKLSWTHHRAVAALDPETQRAWLARAATEGLSVADLKEQIRGSRSLPARDATLEQLRLTAPVDRAERWKAAAERQGLEFGEWAANVLDEAA